MVLQLVFLLSLCFVPDNAHIVARSVPEHIPGVPGINYPDYSSIPITRFTCNNKPHVGFYADMETKCQSFHVCKETRRDSFLCPAGTIFNQKRLACDYWYKVNCSDSPNYYYVNKNGWNAEEINTMNPEFLSSLGQPTESSLKAIVLPPLEVVNAEDYVKSLKDDQSLHPVLTPEQTGYSSDITIPSSLIIEPFDVVDAEEYFRTQTTSKPVSHNSNIANGSSHKPIQDELSSVGLSQKSEIEGKKSSFIKQEHELEKNQTSETKQHVKGKESKGEAEMLLVSGTNQIANSTEKHEPITEMSDEVDTDSSNESNINMPGTNLSEMVMTVSTDQKNDTTEGFKDTNTTDVELMTNVSQLPTTTTQVAPTVEDTTDLENEVFTEKDLSIEKTPKNVKIIDENKSNNSDSSQVSLTTIEVGSTERSNVVLTTEDNQPTMLSKNPKESLNKTNTNTEESSIASEIPNKNIKNNEGHKHILGETLNDSTQSNLDTELQEPNIGKEHVNSTVQEQSTKQESINSTNEILIHFVTSNLDNIIQEVDTEETLTNTTNENLIILTTPNSDPEISKKGIEKEHLNSTILEKQEEIYQRNSTNETIVESTRPISDPNYLEDDNEKQLTKTTASTSTMPINATLENEVLPTALPDSGLESYSHRHFKSENVSGVQVEKTSGNKPSSTSQIISEKVNSLTQVRAQPKTIANSLLLTDMTNVEDNEVTSAQPEKANIPESGGTPDVVIRHQPVIIKVPHILKMYRPIFRHQRVVYSLQPDGTMTSYPEPEPEVRKETPSIGYPALMTTRVYDHSQPELKLTKDAVKVVNGDIAWFQPHYPKYAD